MLEKNSDNCKKYWQKISILLKPGIGKHLDGVICPKTSVKMSGCAAAGLINDYFCNIGETLAYKIPNEQHSFQSMRTDCRLEPCNKMAAL